ncbi:hypothetical protein LNP74_32360 [Klebsiella pneumoniae subsp. pneumoniae]|nr:hypothetical protein [Klebsiella pneumoniae subsp. pneumoniae]
MSPFRLALLCLCLAPLASSAALSGQVHFQDGSQSGLCCRPRHDRIDVSVPAPFTGTGRLDKQPSSLRHAGQSW